MLRAGGEQVDPGGLDGGVAQYIGQLDHIPAGLVEGSGKQVAQVMGKHLAVCHSGLPAHRFHLRPHLLSGYASAASGEKDDIVVSTAVPAETDPGEMTFTIKQAGNRFNLWGVAGLVLMLFLGTGATWLMAGKALKPLGELTDTIEEIGGNNLSRRVEHQDRADEIGQLGRTVRSAECKAPVRVP